MDIKCLIPARGGSKRIKNKNSLLIKGKPLIQYAIEEAKLSPSIDEIWVSTDCPYVKEIAKNLGCQTIRRPELLCTDTCSSEDALLHFAKNVSFDILVFIQATSPLIKSKYIEEGIAKIVNGNCDSVLSVCEDNSFYWNSRREPVNYNPLKRPRSQDKEKWYRENGAFYITTRGKFMESVCRVSGKIDFVVMPTQLSFELDTYEDLELINKIL